jgi:hypothetical protein
VGALDPRATLAGRREAATKSLPSTLTPRSAAALGLLALLAAPGTLLGQGTPLGPEFRVNTYTTNGQGACSVASSATGNFVVVWLSADQDGSLNGIFGQRYASGGAPLGGEFRVNTYTTDMQRSPSVASDSVGNFVVAWLSNTQDGSGFGIFAQRYASTGAPLGSEFRVSSYTTLDQGFPSVASTPAGNFVVAWQSNTQDGDSVGVFAQRYLSTGAALGGEFRVNSYTTGAQGYPVVAADSVGNFVVAWSSYQDGSGFGVFAQRYASTGTPLGVEFRINSYTTLGQRFPSVAFDSAGNFVAAWHSQAQDGNNYGIFAQRYASTGAPLGGEFRVNSYTTSVQSEPSVASDSAGNFVVAWQSNTQDGAGSGVFGQRYLSTGAALGGEFRVNTYTTGYQFFPSVAADSAGNFVVAWQDDTQDGSSFGVFGQRYSMIVPVELLGFRVE